MRAQERELQSEFDLPWHLAAVIPPERWSTINWGRQRIRYPTAEDSENLVA